MKKRIIPAILTYVMILGSALPAHAAQADMTKVSTFAPDEVSLTEGMFLDSQKTGEDCLLSYDVERLAVSLYSYVYAAGFSRKNLEEK